LQTCLFYNGGDFGEEIGERIKNKKPTWWWVSLDDGGHS
jgi:hypothetical protein